MTYISRLTLIVVMGVIFAFLVELFGVPHEAVAPSEPVPVPIINEEKRATSIEDVGADSSEPEEEKIVGTLGAVPSVPKSEPKLEETIEIITKTLTEPIATSSSISLNDRVRKALVNIICTTGPGSVSSISASGVIIDPKGVIITNAHVAQYYLLEDYPSKGSIECTVRTGSPAYPSYTAKLLFLPPSWVQSNAQKIDDEVPTGNGEHDYALLLITDAVGSGALPSSFDYLPLDYDEVASGRNVLIAGYPAGFLGGITIAKELYAASSPATIGQLYTYEGTTVDLFSIGGTVVAQQGSSGGAVADENGNLVGLIVTSTQAAETSARDLRAIAASYLYRDFLREKSITLPSFLAGNLLFEAEIFRVGTMPTLTQALVSVLNQ